MWSFEEQYSVPGMPYREIDYTAATHSLIQKTEAPVVVATELGNALLEIQGDLVLPDEKPKDLTPDEEERFSQLTGEEWAMRFGRLQIEGKKATLFIGTTQRLLGDIKPLEPPLALMKFPENDADENIELIDVLKYRILFTGRPLPIM